MRNVRDISLLTGCVEQLEQRGRALEGKVAVGLSVREALNQHVETDHIASTDAGKCMHSTITNQLQAAKAVTSNGLAEKSSRNYDMRSALPQSVVEEDLEKHGVDPDFIESVTPELCSSLGLGRRGWGELIQLAERLADQNHIHRHAWHEACRIMGLRGAAASVIATVRKYQAGEVEKPGAYLRGMSGRAAKGELILGRTFHGLKDLRQAGAMRAMQTGGDPRSVGDIARRAMRQLVLSGRSS